MDTPTSGIAASNDPFGLDRFVAAQVADYDRALSEIRGGKKRTHWMWYIFPQIDGLGLSMTSKYYAVKSPEEAAAYLRHPVLGPRLLECAEAAASVPAGASATDVFGQPDDEKLRSCATLFASLPNAPPVFRRLLDRYFEGEPDPETLRILDNLPGSGE